MATGIGQPAGSAGHSAARASSAPAEPPITIASMVLVCMALELLVDAFAGHQLPKSWAVDCEPQGLLAPESQESAVAQRVAQDPQRPFLQAAVEVNEHVSAGDKLHLREGA